MEVLGIFLNYSLVYFLGQSLSLVNFFGTESLTDPGTCVYGCMCMPQVVDTVCLPLLLATFNYAAGILS